MGNYENVEILYNKFVSGVSFEPSKFAIYAADAIANSPGLSKYELENEEITSDVAQFSLFLTC